MSLVSVRGGRTVRMLLQCFLVLVLGACPPIAQSESEGEDMGQVKVPRLISKLEKGEQVTIVALGDSNTELTFHTRGYLNWPYLLQEALLAAYRSLGSFRREASFYTWLYRVAVNRAHNELKRRARRGRIAPLDRRSGLFEIEQSGPGPEEDAARRQIQDAVYAALAQLPPKYRTVVVLKDLEGFSQEEIAEVLNCSVGTVKSRVSRARDRLKKILRPIYEEWRDG